MAPLKITLFFLSAVGFASAQVVKSGEAQILDAYLEATPIFPQLPTSSVPAPDTNQPTIVNNEQVTSKFETTDDCNKAMTNLLPGQTGTVTTPNYPESYPPNQKCQWYLESLPGTRIEATFFDMVTQPWFFTYYDYIMISKTGNFSQVDRISGDMNGKTPMTLSSEGNKFGVRFNSNSIFNFRGFRMQYIVVPEDPGAAQLLEVSPYFDGCGLSPILDPNFTTESPVTEEAATVPSENAPVLTPGNPGEGSSPDSYNAVEFDHKIIGNTPAPRHAYPWMVAMLINNRHFCGGSIIDNQHVLTAAHCTDGATQITMLIGVHNIKAPKGMEPSRLIMNVTEENIFQHPDYNEDTIANDVTVIRLPEKLTFSDQIRPVCLPNKHYLSKTFVGENVRVTGWGKNADKATSITPELQHTAVNVMPNGQCRSYFRGIVTGQLICVETTRTASPCRGDSGGPLVVEQQGPSGPYFLQVGIVSFGSYTCERAYPVGFTRTTAYMDFIGNVTGRPLM